MICPTTPNGPICEIINAELNGNNSDKPQILYCFNADLIKFEFDSDKKLIQNGRMNKLVREIVETDNCCHPELVESALIYIMKESALTFDFAQYFNRLHERN